MPHFLQTQISIYPWGKISIVCRVDKLNVIANEMRNLALFSREVEVVLNLKDFGN
jgi:hypothetical protein